MRNRWPRIVGIGDTHMPWTNKDDLRAVLSVIREIKPKFVVQVGDLYDFYSFSRYAKNRDFISPGEEVRQGREAALEFWKAVKAAAPKGAKLIQLRGNHDVRIEKLVYDKTPELGWMLNTPAYKELWEFKGVQTQHDPTEAVYLADDLFAHHGDWLRTNRIGSRVEDALESCVVGHTHRGGVSLLPRKNTLLFELNCGALAYPDSLPLKYMPLRLPKGLQAGVGVVDSLGPRFVPFGSVAAGSH